MAEGGSVERGAVLQSLDDLALVFQEGRQLPVQIVNGVPVAWHNQFAVMAFIKENAVALLHRRLAQFAPGKDVARQLAVVVLHQVAGAVAVRVFGGEEARVTQGKDIARAHAGHRLDHDRVGGRLARRGDAVRLRRFGREVRVHLAGPCRPGRSLGIGVVVAKGGAEPRRGHLQRSGAVLDDGAQSLVHRVGRKGVDERPGCFAVLVIGGIIDHIGVMLQAVPQIGMYLVQNLVLGAQRAAVVRDGHQPAAVGHELLDGRFFPGGVRFFGQDQGQDVVLAEGGIVKGGRVLQHVDAVTAIGQQGRQLVIVGANGVGERRAMCLVKEDAVAGAQGAGCCREVWQREFGGNGPKGGHRCGGCHQYEQQAGNDHAAQRCRVACFCVHQLLVLAPPGCPAPRPPPTGQTGPPGRRSSGATS